MRRVRGNCGFSPIIGASGASVAPHLSRGRRVTATGRGIVQISHLIHLVPGGSNCCYEISHLGLEEAAPNTSGAVEAFPLLRKCRAIVYEVCDGSAVTMKVDPVPTESTPWVPPVTLFVFPIGMGVVQSQLQ